ERLKEAAKLGFKQAIVPKANAPKTNIPGLTIFAVDRIDQAIQAARNLE
ncbi:MAG: repair protein RadA, partial [Pseudomonadota bacterium]